MASRVAVGCVRRCGSVVVFVPAVGATRVIVLLVPGLGAGSRVVRAVLHDHCLQVSLWLRTPPSLKSVPEHRVKGSIMEAQPLRIGTLARAAGVGIETIRYYQRRKLLGTPPKPLNGQRLYPAEYTRRLRFIKRAQALGFSLQDIATLLQLNDGTGHARARQLAAARLQDVERRLADLAAMRDRLAHLIHECEHAHGRVACPIIRTLSGDGTAHEPSPGAGARRPKRPALAS